MARYIEVSKVIHRIFHDFTPDVEKLSIDEAFLDVTGCLRLFGDAETIGRKIKDEIKLQTGLTASVGIAPNKFLAKLASDLEKPDGFTVITEETKQEILDSLPVSKIWGIGKVATQSLHNIGIQTVEQLRTTPLEMLKMVFKNQAEDILRLACGMDDRAVVPYTDTKSISAEQTFSTDIQNAEVLQGILMNQVEEVSQRLRAEDWQGKTITLKFRYGNFKILLNQAESVFRKWHEKSAGPLRLLGFGVSGLSRPGTGQQLLFTDPEEEKQKDVDSVFDKIRQKYGQDSLRRGT
jgi:DNA polymerase-4